LFRFGSWFYKMSFIDQERTLRVRDTENHPPSRNSRLSSGRNSQHVSEYTPVPIWTATSNGSQYMAQNSLSIQQISPIPYQMPVSVQPQPSYYSVMQQTSNYYPTVQSSIYSYVPPTPHIEEGASSTSNPVSAKAALLEAYSELWADKNRRKKKVYILVVLVGYAMTLLGTSVVLLFKDSTYIAALFGAVIMSLGVATFTTVPIDELTFEELANRFLVFRILVCLFLLVGTVEYIFLTIYYFVILPPAGCIFVAAVIPFISVCFQFGCCKTSNSTWILRYFPTLGTLTGNFAVTLVVSVYCQLVFRVPTVRSYLRRADESRDDDDAIRNPNTLLFDLLFLFYAVFAVLIIGWVYRTYWVATLWREETEDFSVVKKRLDVAQTTLLYSSFFFFVGFLYLDAVTDLVVNLFTHGKTFNLYQKYTYIIVPLPYVLIFILGKDKYFTLMARVLEPGIEENLDDAAWMASLASQSDVIDEATLSDGCTVGIMWIYRQASDRHRTPEV
jgi:hypothetical protein